MMKMLLLSAMVVVPCLANQGRFAEDLDDSAPNEAPVDVPTSFGSKIQMTLSGNLASGVYTDAYFTNTFFPGIKTSLNLANTVTFVLNDKRDGSVIVDFTIFDPTIQAAVLQGLAAEIVRQANDPNSALRTNPLFQNIITGAVLLTVLPPTPTHADDDGLSDGAIAGIVIGCLVGVAIIVVLVYCVACKDDESQGGTAVAAPYGDEPQKVEEKPDAELAEKPKDEDAEV